jgi:hypothetical protein
MGPTTGPNPPAVPRRTGRLVSQGGRIPDRSPQRTAGETASARDLVRLNPDTTIGRSGKPDTPLGVAPEPHGGDGHRQDHEQRDEAEERHHRFVRDDRVEVRRVMRRPDRIGTRGPDDRQQRHHEHGQLAKPVRNVLRNRATCDPRGRPTFGRCRPRRVFARLGASSACFFRVQSERP